MSSAFNRCLFNFENTMNPRSPNRPQRNAPAAPQDADTERLAKRVAQMVPCSRREAEQYIEGGWVRVNGVVVEEPQFRVLAQTITMDPDASLLNLTAITLILNKPPGWLDGTDDEDDEDEEAPPARHAQRGRAPQVQNARTLLSTSSHYAHDASEVRMLKRHFNHLDGMVQLETGASGLLVFTQDWRTERKLSEDIGAMEHELIVDVKGEVLPEALVPISRALKDERNPLPQVKVSVNSSTPEGSKLRFAVKGSHPGLVAYLCERAQLDLLAMRRIRLGRVTLSDLPVGQWRYLAEYERF
jgi:23S rRNA pseudouridine2604 synthase